MHTHLKRFIHTITAGAVGLSLLAGAGPALASSHWVSLSPEDLIKLPDDGNPSTTIDTAVYYYGKDHFRYVFPNSNTYFTWYGGFSNIKEVSMEQLGTIGIGGNVTYRPGSRMIKIDSDPKTYAIDRGGARRHVTSEAVAIALYGSDWNRKIDDMPDSFFSNYPAGQPLEDAQDFQSNAAMEANPTISVDKNLDFPRQLITLHADGNFYPVHDWMDTGYNLVVSVGDTAQFVNKSGRLMRVASNPHPIHNALPGFDSGHIPDGLEYVYRFTHSGVWGYHNHNAPSNTGTITVQ